MKKFLKFAVGVGIVIILLYSCSKGFLNNKVVNVVKNTEVDDGLTIGKLLKTVCKESKWEMQGLDDGMPRVIYSGKWKNKDLKMVYAIQSFAGEPHGYLVYYELGGNSFSSANDDVDLIYSYLYEDYIKIKRGK